MSDLYADEKELEIALRDSGMAAEMVGQFMAYLNSKEAEKCQRILSSHRAALVLDVHSWQEKLYCLDFICRKLKQAKLLTCDDR